MDSKFLTRGCVFAVTAITALFSLFRLDTHPLSLVPRKLIDVHVYAGGGSRILHGIDLYSGPILTAEGPLDFTYPPFAAMVFTPLAVLPVAALHAVAVFGNLGICLLAVRWWTQRLQLNRHYGLLAVAFVLSQPVIATVCYGQINLVLLGLILLDARLCLTGSRWRGVLIGIAAAIKLTPAIFVLWFIVRRDYSAVRNSLVAGFVAIAAAAALLPEASFQYFTQLMFQTDRVGPMGYLHNLSLCGVLARVDAPQWVWAVAAVLTFAGCLWAAWRLARRTAPEAQLASLCAVAFLGLFLSPVSWSHHWLWLPLAAMVLLRFPGLRWLAIAGMGLGLGWGVLVAVAPEFTYPVVGALYALFGLGFVCVTGWSKPADAY